MILGRGLLPLARLKGLQLVQRTGKGGQKMGQEIVQLRHLVVLQRLSGLLGGGAELLVARLQLLQALEMGRELVTRMDEIGKEMGLSIRVQREDIFEAMHRI